jgi:hypothetical protein
MLNFLSNLLMMWQSGYLKQSLLPCFSVSDMSSVEASAHMLLLNPEFYYPDIVLLQITGINKVHIFVMDDGVTFHGGRDVCVEGFSMFSHSLFKDRM